MTARRVAAAAAALGLAMLALLVDVPSAAAHATLVSTSPADGARLDAPPGEVVLTFSAEMDGLATVAVTAPDGSSATSGAAVVDGTEVSQRVTDAGEGTYTLAFRAVSADGHPVTGQVSFVVGEPAGVAPRAAVTPSPGTQGEPSSAPTEQASTPSTPSASSGPGLWRRDVVVPGLLFLGAGVLWLLSRRGDRAVP